MQPSEQNPVPPVQPVSNVPEYLHMEPIPDSALRKKGGAKKSIIWALLIILLITGSGAGIAYWLSSQKYHDEAFYQAIESTMGISHVSRDYSFASDSTVGDELSLKIISDFSDQPNPISRAEYELSRTDQGVVVKGEQLVANQNRLYSKLLKSDGMKDSKFAMDSWYQLDASKTNAATYLFDSMKLRHNINTPLGIVITGVASAPQREQFVDRLRTDGIYEIKGNKRQQLDGVGMDVYSVSIRTDGLAKIIKEFAQQTKQQVPRDLLAVDNMNKDVDFWINTDTGYIQKVTYSTHASFSNPGFKGELNIRPISQQRLEIPEATKV